MVHINITNSTDAFVKCTFFQQEYTCTIDYGTDPSYTNLVYRDSSSTLSQMATITLSQRLREGTTYYYILSAESNSECVRMRGKFQAGRCMKFALSVTSPYPLNHKSMNCILIHITCRWWYWLTGYKSYRWDKQYTCNIINLDAVNIKHRIIFTVVFIAPFPDCLFISWEAISIAPPLHYTVKNLYKINSLCIVCPTEVLSCP